jgi:hypothetical protein
MGTKRQKERKKKERENKGKARVLARRHKLRADRKSEMHAARLERQFREKIRPIISDPDKKAVAEEAEKRRVLEKLQRNADILKALEEQYQRDMETKKSVNETLESEGLVDLKDKLQAMETRAREAVNPQPSDRPENSSKVD